MIYRYIIIVLLTTGLNLCSCKKSTDNTQKETSIVMNVLGKKEKKYEWLPTECAPRIYPVEIYKGYLVCTDGTKITIPSGGRTVKNGWGKTGSTYIVGEDFKPVPNQLEITWLSYAENKFYTGSFQLPKDSMTALFEEGFLDRREKQATYSSIVVGMAPGGLVSVWMLGAGSSVEIGQYQAVETEVSMADFNPEGMQDQELYARESLNDISEERKQQLQKEGITHDKWKTYRQRYSWKLEYSFKDQGTSTEVLIEFFNGENIYTFSTNPSLADYRELALPKYTRFYWSDKNKNTYGCKIYFDETEIFEAFKKVYAHPDTKQVKLLLEVDKYNSNLALFLESDQERIPLEKVKVKIYETTE